MQLNDIILFNQSLIWARIEEGEQISIFTILFSNNFTSCVVSMIPYIHRSYADNLVSCTQITLFCWIIATWKCIFLKNPRCSTFMESMSLLNHACYDTTDILATHTCGSVVIFHAVHAECFVEHSFNPTKTGVPSFSFKISSFIFQGFPKPYNPSFIC